MGWWKEGRGSTHAAEALRDRGGALALEERHPAEEPADGDCEAA